MASGLNANGEPAVVSTTIEVKAAATGGQLARTGVDANQMGGAGVVAILLLLAGGALLIGHRRAAQKH